MYLGFMKQGVSIMSLFLGICVFCSFFQFDAGLFVLPIVWFYSFFHVHNLNGLSDEEFKLAEDEYLFHIPEHTDLWLNRKKQTFLAWACIIIGAYALWKVVLHMLYNILPYEVYDIIYSFSYLLPQSILSILLIGLGIHLIQGKKAQLDQEESEDEQFARDAFGEESFSKEAFGNDRLKDFFPAEDSDRPKNGGAGFNSDAENPYDNNY